MLTGEQLKLRRVALGLTQKQLGVKLGYEPAVGERMVQFFEKEKSPIPLNKIRLMAAALEISIEDLIP